MRSYNREKVTPRAMLIDMIDDRRHEDNWIVRDDYTNQICKIEEALDELMRAKDCVIY